MDGQDERQVEKNRNWTGTESLFNPIHRELSVNTTGVSGYNRRSSERKWPERAKGTKRSQQNLEGHCWTRCVRNSEAMRTRLDMGGTPKRRFRHRCVHISGFQHP
ncbi:hypothetical protein PIB30_043302 [Stylosanthes scabra]|uniref:Uncharacterized protein n=1 Tax=Stylosanthes scabra TaxID=79078 RepID=A0ABU6ZEA2_9FABA|nr:hypothetical protein [Stylosanthes scabra]